MSPGQSVSKPLGLRLKVVQSDVKEERKICKDRDGREDYIDDKSC